MLGLMYLLKLRHGDDFCTTTGSSWRLIFVYVLMPWLSKYRAMRRAVHGYEDDSASIIRAPLRAVSLVDARAYALRAVSLMPVASSFIGDSSRGFGGPTDKDKLRALQMENRRLLMQLHLMEQDALKSDDEEGTYVPPPPMLPPVVTEGEERTPSPTLKRDYSVGLTELDRKQPPAWKRDRSAGLSSRRSPPSNLHQVSWKAEP